MTPLTKRVARRCVDTRDAGRRLVVALDLGDTIMVRLEHGRQWYRLSVLEAYHHAVKRALGLKQAARKTKGKP